MTQDEIIERGINAEHLLKNMMFQQTVQELVRIISESVLMTKPEDSKLREQYYYAYQGINDVVGLLNQMVAAKLEQEQAIKAAEEN